MNARVSCLSSTLTAWQSPRGSLLTKVHRAGRTHCFEREERTASMDFALTVLYHIVSFTLLARKRPAMTTYCTREQRTPTTLVEPRAPARTQPRSSLVLHP